MTNTNSSPKREKPAIKVLDAPHTPRPPPTQVQTDGQTTASQKRIGSNISESTTENIAQKASISAGAW